MAYFVFVWLPAKGLSRRQWFSEMEDNRNIHHICLKRALQRDNGPGWIRVAWRPLALGNDGAAGLRLLPFLMEHFQVLASPSSTFFLFSRHSVQWSRQASHRRLPPLSCTLTQRASPELYAREAG